MYFVEKLRSYPEWGGRDWIPNAEDILHTRNRTVGAKAFSFVLNKQKFILTDLGGQRCERSLRLIFSLKLDCMLFFVSLANYNEVLYEDHTTVRLVDSLRLWRDTVNNKTFRNTLVVLFMNKFDIFQEKYLTLEKPIVPTFAYKPKPPKFTDEDGDQQCSKAVNWFKKLYRTQVPDKKQQEVRIHVTSAFDDMNLTDVLQSSLTFVSSRVQMFE